jgi:parallel beta-helix repeat protein
VTAQANTAVWFGDRAAVPVVEPPRTQVHVDGCEEPRIRLDWLETELGGVPRARFSAGLGRDPVTGDEARLENLAVDGNRAENPSKVDGCRTAGIFLYRGDNCAISRCMVRDYNGDGISFQQSNDVQVLNCLAEGNAGKGFHPGSGSQRPVIRGCKSIGNDDDGFFFCWRVRNAVVEDNEFRNNKGFGMSIGHKDSDNLVRKNTVVGNAKGGVYWRNEKDPMAAHRIEFVENTVEDNAEVGLFIDGETNGTVVRNNTIRDSGKGVQKVGVKIGANVGEVVLKDNRIRAPKEVMDERK